MFLRQIPLYALYFVIYSSKKRVQPGRTATGTGPALTPYADVCTVYDSIAI